MIITLGYELKGMIFFRFVAMVAIYDSDMLVFNFRVFFFFLVKKVRCVFNRRLGY